MIISLILSLSTICAAEDHANAGVHDAMQKFVLVRARAVEELETDHKGLVLHTVVITRVYCGRIETDDWSLEVFSLDANEYTGGGFTGGMPISPPLRIGEEMFWLLRESNGQLLPSNDVRLPIRWPVRSVGIRAPRTMQGGILGEAQDPRTPNPQYPRIQMMADALETVWLAESEDERIELLTEYAQSEVWEVAAAAISLLEDGAPKRLNELIRDISVRDLPFRTQIMIDEAMMRLDAKHWRESRERRQVLSAWRLRIIESDEDAIPILRHLGSAIQRGEIEPRTLFNFLHPIITGELRIAMKGEPHSPEVRGSAITLLRQIVNDPELRDNIVAFMLNMLDNDNEVQFHGSVAHVLQEVEEFHEHEFARLRNARDRYVELTAEQEPHRRTREKRMASILEDIVKGHQSSGS